MHKKNRAAFVLLSILTAAPCTSLAADPWTGDDLARQAVFYTVLAADWNQTRQISDDPQLIETNPFLGERPSSSKINRWFALNAVAHAAITHYLPSEWHRSRWWVPSRAAWQSVTIGIEAGYVAHNYSIGVSVEF